MSLSKPYRLRSGQTLLSHGKGQPLVLGDYADDQGMTYLDALVASGQCLFTLATELEETAQLVATKPDVARSRIERLAATLQQLQSNYELVRPAAGHSS